MPRWPCSARGPRAACSSAATRTAGARPRCCWPNSQHSPARCCCSPIHCIRPGARPPPDGAPAAATSPDPVRPRRHRSVRHPRRTGVCARADPGKNARAVGQRRSRSGMGQAPQRSDLPERIAATFLELVGRARSTAPSGGFAAAMLGLGEGGEEHAVTACDDRRKGGGAPLRVLAERVAQLAGEGLDGAAGAAGELQLPLALGLEAAVAQPLAPGLDRLADGVEVERSRARARGRAPSRRARRG